MRELLRISKQPLTYPSYVSYNPFLLFQPILSRVLNRHCLSCALGLVLMLLVLQAVAEYLFFWTFYLVVSVIEKAFREVFNFIWWALAVALAALICLEVYMTIDASDIESLSNEKMKDETEMVGHEHHNQE